VAAYNIVQVYDIVIAGEEQVISVLRVALPDFPRDKLESEVYSTLSRLHFS
jgi:hypothetical protein